MTPRGSLTTPVMLTCILLAATNAVAQYRTATAAPPGTTGDAQSLLNGAAAGTGAVALLDKGVSPTVTDAQGRTPLHLAAANGHKGTVEALLQHGADINAVDQNGNTPMDLAVTAGHTGLTSYLQSKGGIVRKAGVAPIPGAAQHRASSAQTTTPIVRTLSPSLKFKTLPEFEKEIRESGVLLESPNVCLFAPKRREAEARVVLAYLAKAYDELYAIVGTHTEYVIAVYAFPKTSAEGWGGTGNCSIEYDDTNLDFSRQAEWTQHRIPHVSGYIEEMAHSFVHATHAQFGWEMIGWSIGVQVAWKLAGNPLMARTVEEARMNQEQTFSQYVRNGNVFPRGIPPNQCDRIHAWLLYRWESKYGPTFWSDFFREARTRRQALSDAAQLGDLDKIRNARYRITIECLDRLPGLQCSKILKEYGISLTTDVKSLHPESPGWNRRLTE